MNSDSTDDVCFPMAMTRNKRDEFLIDIRKKKNKTLIHQKRIMLSKENCNQVQPVMQIEDSNTANPYLEVQNQQAFVPLTPEMENKLKIAHNEFYAVLQTQVWNDLIPIIRFLRESAGGQPDSIPGKYVIDMEIVPHLLSLLSEKFYPYEDLQHEIIWLLANLAAGTTEDTDYLVEQNIIPILSNCLKESVLNKLHENIMWVLANICGESNLNHRDKILQMGVLDQVVRELSKTPKQASYNKTAAWLMSNLVRGTPFPPFEKVAKCFAALTHLLNEEHEGTKQNSLLSLSYLSQDSKEANLKGIAENNLIQKVVNCINHKNPIIAMYALRIVGNLALGNKRVMNNLYEHEVFKSVPNALKSSDRDLRKEACQTLANIFVNDFDDHDYVVDYDIIPMLIELAAQDDDEIKGLAMLCLYRFVSSAGVEEATVVVNSGFMEVLFQNLASNTTKILDTCLLALYKTLEHGEELKNTRDYNGVNPWLMSIVQNNLVYRIENLVNYPDIDIHKKVSVLLGKFFQNDQM